ncbi:MAG: M23 family metallopeptidase [Gemmatimonadetes bacterium]|nr:M23 family metallopeptidase [Gemmatimonadota bacterium]
MRSVSFLLILPMLSACVPALRPSPTSSVLAPTTTAGRGRPLPEPPAESPAPPEARPDARPATAFEMMAPELEALRDRGLLVPVEGVQAGHIPDTFNEARDGQRRHNAVDILARRGTPVLAADDGVLLRMGKNTLGGNVIWASDATLSLVYYYAHLDHWASGLVEGQPISRGMVLGYVGTTGNAPKDVPHLHFQLLRMKDLHRFTDGPPINPLPFFQTIATGMNR